MSDDFFEIFEDLFESRRKRKYDRYREERYPDERDLRPRPSAPAIFCMKCGARNEAGSKFCLSCGDLLPAPGEEMRCLKCSATLPITAKFCPRCGAAAG